MKITELLEGKSKAPTTDEVAIIRRLRGEKKTTIEIDRILNKPEGWTRRKISDWIPDLVQNLPLAAAVTDQDKQDMANKFTSGTSINKLAQEYGIAASTIQNYLIDKLGQEKVDELKVQRTTPEQKAQIIARYKQDLENGQVNISQIAQDFGFSTGSIYSLLTREKVFQKSREQIRTTLQQQTTIVQKYKDQLDALKTNPSFKIDLSAIAREVGVSLPTVSRILQDAGLHAPKPQYAKALTDQDKEDIVNTYMQGQTPKNEFERKYGISNNAVDTVLASAVKSNKITQQDLDKINILWDKGRKGITDNDVKKMVAMYASGQGPTSIGKIFGITAPTVSYYISIQPNKEELRKQFLANRSLHVDPQAATTNVVTRAGMPGNKGLRTDWGRGGYK